MSKRVPIDVRGLAGHEEIFRIQGAKAPDPEVQAWLARSDDLRLIARAWFERMRRCGSDVREAMHDGCPVACVEDAPFGYVNTFAHHVNVGFFQGADLEDPAGLLEGSGRRMRHVKLRPGQAVDATALSDLVNAAYANIRTSLAAERSQS